MQEWVFWYIQVKVIGGGFVINVQIYICGNVLDYDEWWQFGCEGWVYEDVLFYYCKVEDNDMYNNRYYGQGGLLGVFKFCVLLLICEVYFEVVVVFGILKNEDIVGEK